MQDTLEPGKVTLAEQIIKAGLSELPKSTFMVVFHSSFLIEVQSSYQSGYTTLQVDENATLQAAACQMGCCRCGLARA
jgi:hypothetical protein